MMNKNYAICLDVGGTSLKSAIVNSHGKIMGNSYKQVPMDTQGVAEKVLNVFISTISLHINYLYNMGIKPYGVGIGMPGPFDYEKGICWIEPEQHKFRSLYGFNLKKEFINKLNFNNIKFENDAWTFLRGEVWVGAAKGFNKIIGLTLGTGLGSAFFSDNNIIDGGESIPPLGWIGGMPYGEGIVEHKLTRRWIISRYQEIMNDYTLDVDVIDVANKAKGGDKTCINIFEEMGQRLGRILNPIATKFNAECIVIGGQISKSFSLFENALIKQLDSIKTIRKISPAKHIDLSPIYGAAKLIF